MQALKAKKRHNDYKLEVMLRNQSFAELIPEYCDSVKIRGDFVVITYCSDDDYVKHQVSVEAKAISAWSLINLDQ